MDTSYSLILFDFSGTLCRMEGDGQVYPFPGVRNLLMHLKKVGVKVAVVSNCLRSSLEAALTDLSLRDCVEVVVGVSPDGSGRRKPDPLLYTETIQPLFPNIKRSEVLIVGDSPSDLQFAKNVNAHACWAQYGYGEVSTCLAQQPRYTIARLTELANVLSLPK
jgi:phosphoglycolate phosphatase